MVVIGTDYQLHGYGLAKRRFMLAQTIVGCSVLQGAQEERKTGASAWKFRASTLRAEDGVPGRCEMRTKYGSSGAVYMQRRPPEGSPVLLASAQRY